MSAKDIVLAAAGGGQTTTAIQYVGGKTVSITPSSASNTTISLTDLTGSPSPALQAGDVVVVSYVIASSGTNTPNVTSNTYTTLASIFSSDTDDTNLYVGYKIMGATPDTLVEVTPTKGAGNGGVVAIQAYRYCDSNFPIQQPANTATFASTVRPTPPTITPWEGDCVAVIVGAGAHRRGNVAYTTTGLTSFITSGSTDTTYDASIGMGFRVIQSGSYSPNRFGFPQADGTTYSSAGVSIALKPKPDVAIPTFISYRAGSTSGSSITLTKPTDVQENDFLLLTISGEYVAGLSLTVPSGFTLVGSRASSASSIEAWVYKKIATSSEPASYSITRSSTSGAFGSAISVFRTTNTINVTGVFDVYASTVTTTTSITPSIGGLNLSIWMFNAGQTLVTAPANMTELVKYDNPAGAVCGQFIYSAPAGPYFATLNRSLTINSNVYESITVQLQITQE